MLHKFFQWRYRKTRPGSNPIYRKIDSRSKDRDLIHYFHDFGDDNSGNAQSSHWLLKGFSKIFFATVILLFAAWFAYESYQGLLIYD
ncbi:MAG: hypothetical protein HN627_00665 [Opitutae bacterium]|nr:hypothetical protein [Opitutae bacterium]